MIPARVRRALARLSPRRGRGAGEHEARNRTSWVPLLAGVVLAASIVGVGLLADDGPAGRGGPALPPGVVATGDPVADAYVAAWQRGCQDLRAATTRGVREVRAAATGARRPADVRRRAVAPALRYLDRTSAVLLRLQDARAPARWAAYQRRAVLTLRAGREELTRVRRRAAAGDVAVLARLDPAADPGGPAPADLRRRTPACGAADDPTP